MNNITKTLLFISFIFILSCDTYSQSRKNKRCEWTVLRIGSDSTSFYAKYRRYIRRFIMPANKSVTVGMKFKQTWAEATTSRPPRF